MVSSPSFPLKKLKQQKTKTKNVLKIFEQFGVIRIDLHINIAVGREKCAGVAGSTKNVSSFNQ